MQHDPERVSDTRGWLARAAEDLRAGAFERTADPPIVTDMVFHAQQAAGTEGLPRLARSTSRIGAE